MKGGSPKQRLVWNPKTVKGRKRGTGWGKGSAVRRLGQERCGGFQIKRRSPNRRTKAATHWEPKTEENVKEATGLVLTAEGYSRRTGMEKKK